MLSKYEHSTLPFSRHLKVYAKTLWWHSGWYLRDFYRLHFGESKAKSQNVLLCRVQKLSKNKQTKKLVGNFCFVIVIALAATTSTVVRPGTSSK